MSEVKKYTPPMLKNSTTQVTQAARAPQNTQIPTNSRWAFTLEPSKPEEVSRQQSRFQSVLFNNKEKDTQNINYYNKERNFPIQQRKSIINEKEKKPFDIEKDFPTMEKTNSKESSLSEDNIIDEKKEKKPSLVDIIKFGKPVVEHEVKKDIGQEPSQKKYNRPLTNKKQTTNNLKNIEKDIQSVGIKNLYEEYKGNKVFDDRKYDKNGWMTNEDWIDWYERNFKFHIN